MNLLQNKLAKLLPNGKIIVNGNYVEWTQDGMFMLNTSRQPKDTAASIAARLLDRAKHFLG